MDIRMFDWTLEYVDLVAFNHKVDASDVFYFSNLVEQSERTISPNDQ